MTGRSGRHRLLVALAAAALIASGCGGPMTPHELKQSIQTIISSSRQGQLLADGAAKDSTKTTFTRAFARELGETVDHEAEKLSDADADGELASKKARAVDLCGQIGQQLGELQTAPTDRSTAAEVEQKLRRLSAQTEELYGSI